MTGTVLQGRIKVGDNLEIPSLAVTKKVKSMQMFRKGKHFLPLVDTWLYIKCFGFFSIATNYVNCILFHYLYCFTLNDFKVKKKIH